MDSPIVFPKSGGLALVDGLTALAAFVGAKLHLYSNDLTPNPLTVLADFTESTYTGYAAQTLTWSAAFYDENGVPVSSGGEKLYVVTGGTAEDCFGAFLTDTAGTTLLWAARLPAAPFTFAAAGDTLPLVTIMSAGGGKLTRPAGP